MSEISNAPILLWFKGVNKGSRLKCGRARSRNLAGEKPAPEETTVGVRRPP